MKDEQAILYFQGGFLIPLRVTVAERKFLVPIGVRFQKKRLGAKQINAPGQAHFIIERRSNISVGKPIRTVTQYRRRQWNNPILAFEISSGAKCQPGDVHANISEWMSAA